MGKAPGRHGMQPRILHMFKMVGLDPGAVPASNLVFVRSRRERDIVDVFETLAHRCWPFHRNVIDTLCPKVVLRAPRPLRENALRYAMQRSALYCTNDKKQGASLESWRRSNPTSDFARLRNATQKITCIAKITAAARRRQPARC